jgi:hypothetical protein
MDFTSAPDGALFHGYECVEIDTGEVMTFAVPEPAQLDASVQPAARAERVADAIFDAVEGEGWNPELERMAERLYERSGPLESLDDTDVFAQQTEQRVRDADKLLDQLERDGSTPELEAAIERLCRPD